MKKILALTLSFSMIMSLSLCAFAAHEGDWDRDTYGGDPDYFKVGDQAYSYEDFIDVKNADSHLVPGNEYFFELDWSGRALTDEFFEHYTASVNVGTAFPGYDKEDRDNEENYLSSTSAEKLVKADLRKVNGKYYLHVDVNSHYPYTTEKTLWVYIIAKDKLDSTYRSRVTSEFDIGYSKNTDAVPVNSSEVSVDNDEPVMEFSEDLGNCTIEMEDGSLFEAKFPKTKDTKVNFHHSMDASSAVKMANPNANMRFLSFTATPDFMNKGRLLLKAPGNMKYAYEIDNGTLKQVGASPRDGYIAVITDSLGSYVVSDRALNAPASSTSPANPPAANEPQAKPNVPYNPGTGAEI